MVKNFHFSKKFTVVTGLYKQLSSKESSCNAGDASNARSIPGLGRSLGEGLGNPLQYFCLKNPMDRGAWRSTVDEVTSQTGLSMQAGHSLA